MTWVGLGVFGQSSPLGLGTAVFLQVSDLEFAWVGCPLGSGACR